MTINDLKAVLREILGLPVELYHNLSNDTMIVDLKGTYKPPLDVERIMDDNWEKNR